MKELYLFIPIFIGLMLPGCATVKNSAEPSSNSTKPMPITTPHPTKLSLNSPIELIKSPEMVKVFPSGLNPHHPYKIIAKGSVSKYNLGGIKRQEAMIHDALRNQAAILGGDAIINITRDDKKVTGDVVRFENHEIG